MLVVAPAALMDWLLVGTGPVRHTPLIPPALIGAAGFAAANFYLLNGYLARWSSPQRLPLRLPLALSGYSLPTAYWFMRRWQDGLSQQGPAQVVALCLVSLAFAMVLWIIWIRNRRNATRRQALTFGVLLHFWLFWWAFPWLGEMI